MCAMNQTWWKQQVSHDLKRRESAMHEAAKDKRARKKASHQNKEVTSTEPQGAYDFMCQVCNRLCRSRIVSTAIQASVLQPTG